MSRVYFQFPLCSLNFGDDCQQRVSTIIRYNCVEMARRLWASFSPELRDAHRRMTLPTWCKQPPRNDVELQALLGSQYLNVIPADLGTTVAQHSALCGCSGLRTKLPENQPEDIMKIAAKSAMGQRLRSVG